MSETTGNQGFPPDFQCSTLGRSPIGFPGDRWEMTSRYVLT
ncbi:hypothetical protein [Oscillatoria acuminata]|nr:hypothetical protein [Oscillatoria acuminata]